MSYKPWKTAHPYFFQTAEIPRGPAVQVEYQFGAHGARRIDLAISMTHPFDGFKASAHIDFIKVGRHLDLPLRDTAANRKRLPSFDGRVEIPMKAAWNPNMSWMTIHDPTRRDLQTLIDVYPTAAIEALEIAVDFKAPGGADRCRNVALYKWLRHSLSPQKHKDMSRLRRKQAHPITGKYITLRGTKRPSEENCTTFVWEDASVCTQTRLYIKDSDNKVPVPEPYVRIEGTLKSAGGTQNAGVHRVGLIPDFLPELRRYFMPLLSVGNGYQREKRDVRVTRMKDPRRRLAATERLMRQAAKQNARWVQFGAAGGRAVSPDRHANAIIGTALKRLSERLKGFKEPTKVADYEAWRTAELNFYALFPDGRPISYRGSRGLDPKKRTT